MASRLICLEQWPGGRRCYLRTPLGRLRVHHGLVGQLLVIAGIALVAHDWADRYWLHD